MKTEQPLAMLGGITPGEFLERYWQQEPLLVGALAGMTAPATRPELIDLASRELAPSRLIVSDGATGDPGLCRDPLSPDLFAGLPDRGWTLLVQETDRHLEACARLLERFRFVPNWRIDDVMVSYATDGGGVGPHIDRYDVFLIQASGRRRWRVASRPLESLRPEVRGELSLLARFEPDREWVLEPGDLLYLPPRVAHDGVAVGECLTCSVGFRVPDPRQLYSGFLTQLSPRAFEAVRYADSSLRPGPDAGRIPSEALAELRDAARKLYERPGEFERWVGRHVTGPLRDAPPGGAWRGTIDELRVELARGATLERSAPAHFAWLLDGEGSVILFVGGEEYELGPGAEARAEELCGRDALDEGALDAHLRNSHLGSILVDAVARGFLVLSAVVRIRRGRWETEDVSPPEGTTGADALRSPDCLVSGAAGGRIVRVLVIGAGKSTAVLIDYLLGQAAERDWRIHVVDRDAELARARVGDHTHGTAGTLNVEDADDRDRLIGDANLVVSMLPAHMHGPVAESCVDSRVHFVSASYVSGDVRDLDQAAGKAGITILNEVGVDPGIDHMSAMEKLDGLRARGAKIRAFETFTGGLVAPEFDDNPWRYKLTWNPRNVVLAGQGGVKFKHHGRFKYIPYHRLFKRFERLQIPEYGEFEAYPNRDSLKYRHSYGLRGIDTIYRGTLRRPGFCDAWDCLVQLGLTDDSESIERLGGMTYRDLVNSFLWYDSAMSVELKVRAYLKLDLNAPEFDKLEWLGLFEPIPVGLSRGTPAQALQKLLETKWALKPEDRDMIAMLHKIEYELDGRTFREESSMVTLGSDSVRTAMAKTVGLTAGIAAKLILTGGIQARGVQIPTSREVYAPILAELREFDMVFEDRVEEVE